MTTIKQYLCGAAVASLVAGAGAAVGTQVGLSALTADWMLTAEHVLLIGVDGVNLSKVLEYAYNEDSGFKTAMDQGITGTASIVNHTTLSGPSWSTILTGVWDDKHGVFNNLFRAEPYNLWPSVFNLIEYNKPEIDTTIISNWEYLNKLADAGGYAVDNNVFVPAGDSPADSDELVTALTIAQIMGTLDNPDDISSFLFSYQSQADHAGHEFAGGSEEYMQAVINLGNNIQQILAAIAYVQAETGDDWSILITTDHGHTQSVTLPGLSIGHGFQSPNETTSFVIFDQAGDNATDGGQNLNYSIADITPTILALLGVPLRSDFDGVSLTDDPTVLDSFVQPVDLQQALYSAIAMFGYPNIGNEITLGIRTLVGSVPYFLNTFVNQIDQYLQGIVDQDIFLISALAQGTQWVTNAVGGLMVDSTNAVAHAIALMLGSGVIAPTDAPLPVPGGAEFTIPDLGGSDLSLLLDLDALAG
ncbi:alkaline phosphatase family protein [Mycolicibacter longobardus]|uniref:Phosphodiesterase n=1 Tax=Mycolicibacter longobardus TaxID=1108812 RepID=A0A1X1YEA9_9MYCO|nr:alkaline phosphatase family protein [Mycolicibacter longobardus]MCV7383027.1 alkaline phosphatase family protein [Mycolicibacter longobardus]ORW09417.1 phosphodiesterase [Mycolicibacter longobardus]